MTEREKALANNIATMGVRIINLHPTGYPCILYWPNERLNLQNYHCLALAV